MKDNIQVVESTIENDFVVNLKIDDVESKEEALEAAEEWCDQNNSVIVGEPLQVDELSQNGKLVFNVKVGSDDYK